MVRAVTSVTCVLALTLTSACTSFYGPVRPIQAGRLGGAQACDSPPAPSSPILEREFKTAACASLGMPREHEPAVTMHEAGFLLVTARCNDFFAQKAAPNWA